jgi:tetratricopeptide (TPR) repeat protein
MSEDLEGFSDELPTAFKATLALYQKMVSDLKGTNPDVQGAMVWVGRGGRLYDSGKMQEAVSAYKKALALDPRCVVAWANMGAALSCLGLHFEGLAATELATRLQADEKNGAAVGITDKGQSAAVVGHVPGRVCNIMLSSGEVVSISIGHNTLAIFNRSSPFLQSLALLVCTPLSIFWKNIWEKTALWTWDISSYREMSMRISDPLVIMESVLQEAKSEIENCQTVKQVKDTCRKLHPRRIDES